MLNESQQPPKFFPSDFKENVGIILNRVFGITVDGISHGNCRNVYLKLVHLISALVEQSIPVCSAFELQSTSDSDNE